MNLTLKIIFRDHDDDIMSNVINKSIDYNLLPKISVDCRDALLAMLERNPSKRISASELLQHPWIKVCSLYLNNFMYNIFV